MGVMATRIDSLGTLRAPTRTDEGFLTLHGYATRSGVFKYKGSNGKIRKEYRPPEEVRKAESLATLKNKPVTIRHPRDDAGRAIKLNPENVQAHAVGTLGSEVDYDEASGHVPVDVHVTRADGIKAVQEQGLRHLSCVYDCDAEAKKGVTPDGEPYDVIQRNIKYNSVAITELGRGGTTQLRADEAELVVDADEDTQPTPEPTKGSVMAKVSINGVEYDGLDPALARDIKSLQSDLDTQKTRADEADEAVKAVEGQRDAYKKQVEEANEDGGEDEFLTAYKERQRIEELAKSVGVEITDESNADAKRKIVEKQLSGIRADADDVYIDACFDVLSNGDIHKQKRKQAGKSAMSGAGQRNTRADEADEAKTVREQERDFVTSLRAE